MRSMNSSSNARTARLYALIAMIVLVISGIFMVAIGINAFFQSFRYEEIHIQRTFNVNPRDAMVLSLPNIRGGDAVRIEFTVRGGNNDIYFSVMDPDGYYIYGPTLVYYSYSYEFVAKKSGEHIAVFDNRFSLITSKYVFANVYIKPKATQELRSGSTILMVVGAIMILAGPVAYITILKHTKPETVSGTQNINPISVLRL